MNIYSNSQVLLPPFSHDSAASIHYW